MTMRFRYATLRTRHPVMTLGGRASRPRALIGVTILGPAGVDYQVGLADTGADDTVFPESVARRIGIDLTTATKGMFVSAAGQTISVQYAPVTLRMTDGIEFREWATHVGFVTTPIRCPLLGFAGFLQFFTATFHGDREEVELAANSLFPAP